MSKSADIKNDMFSEEELLGIMLDSFEELEWEDHANAVADKMMEKGYAVPSFYLQRVNKEQS